MILLNLGAGATRPGPPWVNLDSLRSCLYPDTPERNQLDSEPNYVDYDMLSDKPWPFPENHFDGILASHVLEHFDTINGTRLLKACFNMLVENGVLMVSVPDASYHRKVYPQDTRKNAYKLFGENIPANEPKGTFLEYALFFDQHLAVYAEDSLWCMFIHAGFRPENVYRADPNIIENGDRPINYLHGLLNRRQFSLIMVGQK